MILLIIKKVVVLKQVYGKFAGDISKQSLYNFYQQANYNSMLLCVIIEPWYSQSSTAAGS
jgi:hypothetical protein